MAERPIFLSSQKPDVLVEEISVSLAWHSGFAPIQKQRNISELHSSAKIRGYWPLLEVSTKSLDEVGQRLSAFNLKTRMGDGCLPIELAFQGSKVFEHGGPFTDLYDVDPKFAKRDERLKQSGRLVGFRFEGFSFPNRPVTAFYDWLYLSAIYPHRDWLTRLERYVGFTDIEFNPEKSVNCQARSCALFFALRFKGLLDQAMSGPERFVSILKSFAYMQSLPAHNMALKTESQQVDLALG